jgi:short-subunit dehydrogenase
VSVLCPNTIRADGPIQAFIDRLGLHCRLACLSPEQIAREALRGLLRGKAIIVPGIINRLIHVIAPFVPRAVVVRVIRRYWGEYIIATKAVPPDTRLENASPRLG